MEWLIDILVELVFSQAVDSFFPKYQRIKRYCLKKKLKSSMKTDILNKYGDRVYYNRLDQFLQRTNLIGKIIENCIITSVYDLDPQVELIQYYEGLFIAENPAFANERTEIHTLLCTCFSVAFGAFNSCEGNETARIITSNLGILFNALRSDIEGIVTKLDLLDKKVNILVSSHNAKSIITPEEIKSYLAYLLVIHRSSISPGKYIDRVVYAQTKESEQESITALEALLKHKKILLLGEAGCGKTIECIEVLRHASSAETTNFPIPIYFPLVEWGKLYGSTAQGVAARFMPYVGEQKIDAVMDLAKTGKLMFIFDGIDDISDQAIRSACIADIKNTMLQYSDCYFFITSLANRYHEEFGDIQMVQLKKIGSDVVKEVLQGHGIHLRIPSSYYELFANPLLLSLGIKVLKNVSHPEMLNRSFLFEQLFTCLCKEWDQKKAIYAKQRLSYIELLNILGEFSYNTYNQNTYTFIEFDILIGDVAGVHQNKQEIIDEIISLGVFTVKDSICFVHKLFKEYCVAYYLFLRKPFKDNRRIYNKIIRNEAWREPLVFIAGLYKNISEQDPYLDFVLEHDLKLYIECVNGKNDLVFNSDSSDQDSAGRWYLSTLLKSYRKIIDCHFHPMREKFEPSKSIGELDEDKEKVRIVGRLSCDGSQLDYWFDRVSVCETDVLLLPVSQLGEAFRKQSDKVGRELLSFSVHYVNLKLSKLEGDSARKVAIELLKSELNRLIKSAELIEGPYLLCDRIKQAQKKHIDFRGINSIGELHEKVIFLIEEAHALTGRTTFHEYHLGDVKLLDLLTFLQKAQAQEVDFNKHALPQIHPEFRPGVGNERYYTKEQMTEYLTRFFYFHRLSYADMAKNNFPTLYERFLQFQDLPYVEIVSISDPQSARVSEPTVNYYHIAAESNSLLPTVRLISSLDAVSENNKWPQVKREIEESYRKKGLVAHRVQYTTTFFSSFMDSDKWPSPLSKYVYESVKSSLEEIVGRM